ncbi:MAG: glycosyltransferase family 4 protein [bacterium]
MKNNKELKTLIFSDFFFPDSMGGANKMAYHSSRGLVKKGHRVMLVTRRARPDLPDRETIDGIEVFRYDLPRKTFTGYNFSARPKIRKILNSIEGEVNALDLIILHQPLVALEAVTHPFIGDTPWIYNFHSPWGEEFRISRSFKWLNMLNPGFLFQKRIKDWIEDRVLKRCQRIIVLSRFMQEQLENIHGMSNKSVIIPGGVDTEVFSPPKDKCFIREELGLPQGKIILFTVRNLRQRMGLMNLIKAMVDLGDIREKVHLVIGGKGDLGDKLKRFSADQKIENSITFSGHISQEDLPKFYKAADFFILPTEKLEGFGMVTLEALATGLPVIATPVGATPEIINQVDRGWLCEDSSSKSLSLKIAYRSGWFIQHPHEYKEVSRRCRNLAVKKYSWPRIMEHWETECEEVIEACKRWN